METPDEPTTGTPDQPEGSVYIIETFYVPVGRPVGDWWSFNPVPFLIILAAGVLAAWALHGIFDGNASTHKSGGTVTVAASTPKSGRTVTMAQLLASENFAIGKHSVCQVRWVNNSQSLRLMLNRGNGCQKAIRVVLPAEKVPTFSNKSVHHSSATFVYDQHALTPEQAAAFKSLALGVQLKQYLRYVYVRLTPRLNHDVQLTQSTDVIVRLKGGATVWAVVNR